MHCGAVQRLYRAVTILRLHMRAIARHPIGFCGFESGPSDPRLERTVDAMGVDQAAHQSLGFFSEMPEPSRGLFAQHLLQGHLVEPLTGAQLPAIAPRGPKAHAMGL